MRLGPVFVLDGIKPDVCIKIEDAVCDWGSWPTEPDIAYVFSIVSASG